MRIRRASNTFNTVRVGIIACCAVLLSACAGSPAAPPSAPASVPAAANLDAKAIVDASIADEVTKSSGAK